MLACEPTKEGVNTTRVELRACHSSEFAHCVFDGPRGTIGASRGQSVECIGHGNDPCFDWNRFAGQPVGIPSPVVPFVVGAHDLCHVGECPRLQGDLLAPNRVVLHALELFSRERTRLEENVVWDDQLADVVDSPGRFRDGYTSRGKPEFAGKHAREIRHARHVVTSVLILRSNCVFKRLERRRVRHNKGIEPFPQSERARHDRK